MSEIQLEACRMLKTVRGCLPVLITGTFLLFPLVCSARCLGPASFQTCDDPESGMHVDISRFGHEAVINGIRPDSGQTYQEFSTTIGHTTYIDGIDYNGRPRYEVRENFSRDFTDSYGINVGKGPYIQMKDTPPEDKARMSR